MKFFHETIENIKKDKQKTIDHIKQDIIDLDSGETLYNEAYDVVEALRFDFDDVELMFCSKERVRLDYDIPKHSTVQEGVTNFIDALEDLLFLQGYTLNANLSTNKDPWYYFYYEKNIKGLASTLYAAVYIGRSEHCKMVEKEVWKKDTEYIYVCKEA